MTLARYTKLVFSVFYWDPILIILGSLFLYLSISTGAGDDKYAAALGAVQLSLGLYGVGGLGVGVLGDRCWDLGGGGEGS